jgi:2-amino-4-hydroxy-6-hydroxymethyldihydropteridine diphosphokinase/dihydropteroate synthase
MKCYVGLGSNLGDRRANLESAARALRELSASKQLRVSPIHTTPALMPEIAPPEWNIPYLNAAAEINWNGTANELFQALQKIESDMGRVRTARWAPRVIDLDLLICGDMQIVQADLTVPHPRLRERAFVLGPLRDLAPGLKIQTQTSLSLLRRLKEKTPLWMGIVNLTPDSFSDGGELNDPTALTKRLQSQDVHVIDLGAESTRPGASTVQPEEEWRRLRPAFEILKDHFNGKIFKPLISVDTRYAATAARAIEFGANWINDVSGAADPEMIPLLRSCTCEYVLMHSLSVPPIAGHTIPTDKDPVYEIKEWSLRQIERLGIETDRVILDPGIGFGKTAQQSITILKEIDRLFELSMRILVAHSRKSFQRVWAEEPAAAERDIESVGVSIAMAAKGVDILRVHNPEMHIRAYRALSEVS